VWKILCVCCEKNASKASVITVGLTAPLNAAAGVLHPLQ